MDHGKSISSFVFSIVTTSATNDDLQQKNAILYSLVSSHPKTFFHSCLRSIKDIQPNPANIRSAFLATMIHNRIHNHSLRARELFQGIFIGNQRISVRIHSMTLSSSVQVEDDLLANYEIETFSYYFHAPSPSGQKAEVVTTPSSQNSCTLQQRLSSIDVNIQSATSTRGSHLVSQNRDRTGIMIWPATHLLCQFLASNANLLLQGSVLELGAGVGLVGIMACKCKMRMFRDGDEHGHIAPSPEQQSKLLHWVSTDMDETALQLIQSNQQLNNIYNFVNRKCNMWTRKLKWGNVQDIQNLQNELYNAIGLQKFDTIVGADIVYPTTSGQTLHDLFVTVNSLLEDHGTFYLSFCTRDGCKTPQRLIRAASTAQFAIQPTPALTAATLDSEIQKRLPPLLDTVVLKLVRDPDAAKRNHQLGKEHCLVFPHLERQIEQLRMAEEDQEQWDPPFAVDSEP